MAVNAGDGDVRQGSGAPVEIQGIVVGDAELGFLQTGGNIWVRFWINIRIDPEADRGFLVALAGHLVEAFQFSWGFNVEAENSRRDSVSAARE